MKNMIVLAVLVITVCLFTTGYTAGPPEANVRNAFKMILSQADANKDGKLSATECKTIYKDENLAKKNCAFWDVDKDGFITEDEYVKQATNIGNKKKR
jgi:Ca2+-binding EF-hand superfamily protein